MRLELAVQLRPVRQRFRHAAGMEVAIFGSDIDVRVQRVANAGHNLPGNAAVLEIVIECGIEVVEVNPILDTANRTALLAVELIASAMGKRILQ